MSLEIKNESITVDKKINSEEYFIKKFKTQGWNCIKSKSWLNYEINNLELVSFLHKNDESGIPDLVLWNDKEFFFVEVKCNGDVLKSSQIKWINKHNDKKIFIYHLYQLIISKDMYVPITCSIPISLASEIDAIMEVEGKGDRYYNNSDFAKKALRNEVNAYKQSKK